MEIDHLKSNFRKNNSPPNFIDSCIKSFSNDVCTPKVIVHNDRDDFVKLLFQNLKKASKIFADKLTSGNLKVVFTSRI